MPTHPSPPPAPHASVLVAVSGTDEELAEKVASAKEDVDVALFLGAPMIRIFTGILADPVDQQREIRCFQEIADYVAQKGISVGLQNHPSTGDEVRRILEETDRPNFTFLLDTGQWKDAPMYNGGGPTPADIRSTTISGRRRPTQRTCAPSFLRSIRAGRNISTMIELCRCSSMPAITDH